MALVKEDFPRILKRLMSEQGVNRPKLAEALKVSYSTVRDWENGRMLPEMSRLDDLAKIFRVDRRYFLGTADPEPAKKHPPADDDVDDFLREMARRRGFRLVKMDN